MESAIREVIPYDPVMELSSAFVAGKRGFIQPFLRVRKLAFGHRRAALQTLISLGLNRVSTSHSHVNRRTPPISAQACNAKPQAAV
jgi:hypothetical protein